MDIPLRLTYLFLKLNYHIFSNKCRVSNNHRSFGYPHWNKRLPLWSASPLISAASLLRLLEHNETSGQRTPTGPKGTLMLIWKSANVFTYMKIISWRFHIKTTWQFLQLGMRNFQGIAFMYAMFVGRFSNLR